MKQKRISLICFFNEMVKSVNYLRDISNHFYRICCDLQMIYLNVIIYCKPSLLHLCIKVIQNIITIFIFLMSITQDHNMGLEQNKKTTWIFPCILKR